MRPFTTLNAVAVPLDLADVDTDRIIPARFLTQPRSAGFGRFAFHDLRFDDDGRERPEFPLNQGLYRDAEILVTGPNFGCGSSREGAVWALADLGVRALVGPGFGDIFYGNCCKNGLLPVRLGAPEVAALRAQVRARPGSRVTIDLSAQTVIGPDGSRFAFEIDPFRRECLLKGMDDVDLTLQHEDEIARYEARRAREAPWAAPWHRTDERC